MCQQLLDVRHKIQWSAMTRILIVADVPDSAFGYIRFPTAEQAADIMSASMSARAAGNEIRHRAIAVAFESNESRFF